MDQGQCLMWASKRKCSNNNNNNSILGASTKSTYSSSSCDEYYSSWEEQAFAKDSAGGASGCIWPPRSYSCSFCRREFRSAQALGGHMNVHRRDRARLKQPSSPQNENHVQNYPFSSLGNYFGFSSNSSNNPSSYDHALDVLPSPSEALPDKNFREEAMMIPLCNSASSVPYSSYSKSKPGSGEDYCRLLYSHELLDPESDAEKKASKGLDYYSSGCIRSDERDIDEKTDDVAVSLNLFVRRTHNHHPSMQFETNEEEADLSLKKRKTEYGSSIIPLSPKSSSDHKHHHVQSSQVFEFSTSFIEELDLELRLGYRSQV